MTKAGISFEVYRNSKGDQIKILLVLKTEHFDRLNIEVLLESQQEGVMISFGSLDVCSNILRVEIDKNFLLLILATSHNYAFVTWTYDPDKEVINASYSVYVGKNHVFCEEEFRTWFYGFMKSFQLALEYVEKKAFATKTQP